MGRWRALVACGLVGALMGACREPTQITLDMRTNLACASVRDVAIYGGFPAGGPDFSAPLARTSLCDASGNLGTVVSTPKTADDARVSFRVVIGVNARADSCNEGNAFAGCIVMRRTLRYLPHARLRLPFIARLRCVDVPCRDGATCDLDGLCQSDEVNETACLERDECDPSTPPATSSSDGGLRDASPSADSARDATSDAGGDGDGDSGESRGDAGSQVSIKCTGEPGGVCTGPGALCCARTQAPPSGTCSTTSSCTGGRVPIACDDPSDCGPTPLGLVCCLAVDRTEASCRPASQCAPMGRYTMCQAESDCTAPAHCSTPFPELPAYTVCI